MNKIHKLIYKELLPTVLIALLVLTFIAFSKEFHRFAQLLITSGTSMSVFIQVLLIILSNVLFFTLPIALLIGTVSCFSRLSSDSEIIAIKACGVSTYRFLSPILIPSALLFAITFLLTTTLAPNANNHFRTLQYEVAVSQLTTEIQPRVFNEKFANYILYVEDIERETNTWKGIFLVENSANAQQKIYLAQSGHIFFHSERKVLQLHLEDGAIHSVSMDAPASDAITFFGALDIPLKNLNITQPELQPKRNREKSMSELRTEIQKGSHPPGSDKQVGLELEYYRRLALPFACFVFGFIGIPLGLITKRGGRSSGFVISLFVVFLYYIIFAYSWKAGVHYNIFPVKMGVWIANILFALVGFIMLWSANAERHLLRQQIFREFFGKIDGLVERCRSGISKIWNLLCRKTRLKGVVSSENSFRFARVLDTYILKEFLKILAISIAGALILFTIFTLFEIIDEIYSHQIPWPDVVEYFFYVWPMILVLVLPLCILISILVSIGLLEKTTQVTALKASGISIYRMSTPIVVAIILLSAGIFVMQEFILPYTNQRQDNLHNEIKGRKIQTYYNPEITWIMGRDGKIYHYSYFDFDRNVFADLSVYQLDLTRARLLRRLYAPRALWEEEIHRWILINGWKREFGRDNFTFSTFENLSCDLTETPAYFKTELKRSDKMSYVELSSYIEKLKAGGFDTLSLEVDLYKKISYPMVSVIMLFIGIPFSFKMGKKGALYGVAVSILAGILFWALFNVSSAMGGHGIIPPLLAAWAPNLFFGFSGLYLVLKLRT